MLLISSSWQHKTSIPMILKECKCNAYACPLPSYPTRYEAASYPSLGNVGCCTGTVVTIGQRHNPQEHSGIVLWLSHWPSTMHMLMTRMLMMQWYDATASILTSSAIYIHNHKTHHLPSYDRQILTTYVIYLHNNKIYHLPHDDKQMTKDSTMDHI